jgi:hypothetical protein
VESWGYEKLNVHLAFRLHGGYGELEGFEMVVLQTTARQGDFWFRSRSVSAFRWLLV